LNAVDRIQDGTGGLEARGRLETRAAIDGGEWSASRPGCFIADFRVDPRRGVTVEVEKNLFPLTSLEKRKSAKFIVFELFTHILSAAFVKY
jgi:hypothetical protein